MPLYDHLTKYPQIKHVLTRHEQGAAHAADGYARSTGKVGVCIATSGPGAINLVVGLATAYMDSTPMVAITGQVTRGAIGKDAFQEIDQQALFETITKKTWSIKQTSKIPEILSEAFNLALTPRCGPVHINLPRDVLADSDSFGEFTKLQKTVTPVVLKEDIEKTIDIILSSSQPVIIAGGGIKYNSKYKNVIKLAELLNIPMVTAAGHGDAIPFNHKLNAGQMGPRGNPVASKLVKEASVIIALGTRLGFNSTFYSYENINKRAKIIQVELEKSMIGRYFPVAVGINGDAATVTDQIYKEIKKQNIILDIKKWTNNYLNERKKFLINRDQFKQKNFPIQPKGLFKQLRQVLPKNSAITLDAGTLCLQATDALEYYDPPSLFTPLDFGLVGFSFACGLGVKIAKPSKKVISLMGDGGFGMTISELSTAVEYKINTITIVMNNKSWGAEKAYQKDFYGKRYLGADISSPPFDKVAELYGAKGFKVKKVSEINQAVREALKINKPVVIDVDVDPKALYSFRRDSFKHRSKK